MKFALPAILFLGFSFFLPAQNFNPGFMNPGSVNPASANPVFDDPALLIGARLEDVINSLGPPESVYPARGIEAWQDDVVFVYGSLDVYFYKDRVWQVGSSAAYGIHLGDSREQAAAAVKSFPALGNQAGNAAGPVAGPADGLGDGPADLYYSVPGRAWPIVLRVNMNGSETGAGKVSGLFVYRSDF